jgi:hypothetical protein
MLDEGYVCRAESASAVFVSDARLFAGTARIDEAIHAHASSSHNLRPTHVALARGRVGIQYNLVCAGTNGGHMLIYLPSLFYQPR